MKNWLIASLLAVVGIIAPFDVVAVTGQDEMDSMIANIGRNMVTAIAEMSEGNTDADDAKSTLRRAAATTTPYSLSVVGWDARSTCAAASPTITISCATGGAISLLPSYQFGVSKCTSVGTNTVKCTKLASAATAYVNAKCTGKYPITATLPAFKFTGCKNSAQGNYAYQLAIIGQLCAIKANVKNYTNVYSKQCGVASQLFVDKTNNVPSCLSKSFKCVNTTKTTCAITTNAVKISTPTTTNALCIFKY